MLSAQHEAYYKSELAQEINNTQTAINRILVDEYGWNKHHFRTDFTFDDTETNRDYKRVGHSLFHIQFSYKSIKDKVYSKIKQLKEDKILPQYKGQYYENKITENGK